MGNATVGWALLMSLIYAWILYTHTHIHTHQPVEGQQQVGEDGEREHACLLVCRN